MIKSEIKETIKEETDNLSLETLNEVLDFIRFIIY